jgi:hypothetical protein
LRSTNEKNHSRESDVPNSGQQKQPFAVAAQD